MVDQVMTSVKGGTIASAAAMRARLNKEGVMDVDTFQAWAATIPDAPALLSSEVGMIDWKSESRDFSDALTFLTFHLTLAVRFPLE